MAANPAMISPAPRSQPVAARQLKAFLSWWRGELLALLPPAWRERLTGGLTGTPIGLREHELVGYRVDAGDLREVSRVPLAGLEAAAGAAALRRLVEAQGGKLDHLTLVLPPEVFIRKTVELPAAAEENLDQVLGFELDRHTPFKSSQARYASRVLEHGADPANIRIDLVAAPKDKVEAIAGRLTAMGGQLSAIVPEVGGARWRELNLLKEGASQRRVLGGASRLNVALAGLFVILLLAALIIPIWQKRQAAIALLPRLNAVKVESERIQKIRTELERLASDANFIEGKKHAAVPASLLIEDLAKVFPDHTWVAILEVKPNAKQRELVLTGEAASATKVVELLDQLPYLKNPTFRSPLTKVPGQASERFVIAAEIRSRPLPANTEELVPGPAVPPPAMPMPATPAAPAPQVPAAPALSAPQAGDAVQRPELKAPPASAPADARQEKAKP